LSGIAGWVNYTKKLENSPIKAMIKQNAHPESRGGEEGFWVSENVLLGASGADQPAILKRGEAMVVLVFSGELYNTADLARELTLAGYKTDATSPLYTILHAYLHWGTAFLNKLNGVFSLALRDAEKHRLILARDRLGVKSLFYTPADDGIIFASSLKSLMAHPEVTPRLAADGLAEIFATGPGRTPGHGVLQGIHQLLPGSCLIFDQSGIKRHKYWKLATFAHEEDFEETASSVRELVFDATRRQISPDAGFLLSGGLDSSALTAIAKLALGRQVTTLSVDYRGNDKHFRPNAFQPNTDASYVRRMTGFLKSDHETYVIDTPELVESLYDAVRARDFPGMADIDSAMLLFSRWIAKRTPIGITGECADEFFGGYPWFYRPGAEEMFPWARNQAARMKLLSPDLISMIQPEEYLQARYEEAVSEIPFLPGEPEKDAKMRKISYLTMTRWLPVLLERQDTMSRAAGLTLRAPFADYRIIEYMWNVPWEMKYRHSREKGLLRYALTDILPDDVLWRKKSPFPKTHNPNYIDAIRELAMITIDDPKSPLAPLINKEEVRKFAQSLTRETDIPWFGQLMNAPQMLAYLIQIDFWLREYGVGI